MSTIAISDLCPAGCDFFSDSENYLRELNEAELMFNQGGSLVELVVATAVTVVAASVSAAVGYITNRDKPQPVSQCVQPS